MGLYLFLQRATFLTLPTLRLNLHLCWKILKFICLYALCWQKKVRHDVTSGFSSACHLLQDCVKLCRMKFFYPSAGTRNCTLSKAWVVHMSALSTGGHIGAVRSLMCTLSKCQQRLVHRPRLQERKEQSQVECGIRRFWPMSILLG